jgi:D-galactarolactone cycloisomerase
MKITGVDVHSLVYPLDGPRGDGQGLITARPTTLVRVSTDEGLVGWGQGGRPAVIRDRLAPALLGQDPRDTTVLWYRMEKAARGDRASIGAVDVALWDLKGKSCGRSVAQLLGGAVRDAVPAYASLHNYTPAADLRDELSGAIRDAQQRGFRALKLKVGGRPLAEDLAYLRLAREIAGSDLALMADANQTYTVPMAMKVGRLLDALEFAWYEEPIPRTNVTGYQQLCASLDLTVAGYEGTGDPAQIAPILAARAVDLYQPDLVGCGGFTVAPHLAAIAAAFDVAFTCHVWDSALIQTATIHLLATLPPWQPLSTSPIAPPLEVTTLPRHPLNQDLLVGAPTIGPDGTIAVPSGPGLGVDVNPAILERYAVHQ